MDRRAPVADTGSTWKLQWIDLRLTATVNWTSSKCLNQDWYQATHGCERGMEDTSLTEIVIYHYITRKWTKEDWATIGMGLVYLQMNVHHI